jgi:hypothetical protein
MIQSDMLCNTAPSGIRRLIPVKRWGWRYPHHLPKAMYFHIPLGLLTLCDHRSIRFTRGNNSHSILSQFTSTFIRRSSWSRFTESWPAWRQPCEVLLLWTMFWFSFSDNIIQVVIQPLTSHIEIYPWEFEGLWSIHTDCTSWGRNAVQIGLAFINVITLASLTRWFRLRLYFLSLCYYVQKTLS